MNVSTEQKQSHRCGEQTCGCQVGEEGSGMDWKFGVGRCKLLYLEWISNEVLLYSAVNYIQSLGIKHDGRQNEKKNVDRCMMGCFLRGKCSHSLLTFENITKQNKHLGALLSYITKVYLNTVHIVKLTL